MKHLKKFVELNEDTDQSAINEAVSSPVTLTVEIKGKGPKLFLVIEKEQYDSTYEGFSFWRAQNETSLLEMLAEDSDLEEDDPSIEDIFEITEIGK
jgi:hypothetical protein